MLHIYDGYFSAQTFVYKHVPPYWTAKWTCSQARFTSVANRTVNAFAVHWTGRVKITTIPNRTEPNWTRNGRNHASNVAIDDSQTSQQILVQWHQCQCCIVCPCVHEEKPGDWVAADSLNCASMFSGDAVMRSCVRPKSWGGQYIAGPQPKSLGGLVFFPGPRGCCAYVVSHLVVSHLTTLLCSPYIYLLFCLLATVYLGE